MRKHFLTTLIFSFSLGIAFSQKISREEMATCRKKEDSLKVLAGQIIGGISAADRLKADSNFTRMFVRALKIPYSFYYPFDSLVSISRLVPPDSSFKIFTWQLNINDEVTRQHGAIQMKTADGSLKLLPLIDRSENTANMVDTIGDNFGWMGAVYYQLVQKQAGGKPFYTLLGYDENNLSSNKKLIEVLTFDNGTPVFGGKYFSPLNEIFANAGSRFIMQYKKNAGPRLTYDKDLDMIVYEHLVPESGEPEKKYTYIPDGDYEGLQWRNGKWVHIDKIFTQQLNDGQAPLPNPLRDDKGNIDETRLKTDASAEDNPTGSSGGDRATQAPKKARPKK